MKPFPKINSKTKQFKLFLTNQILIKKNLDYKFTSVLFELKYINFVCQKVYFSFFQRKNEEKTGANRTSVFSFLWNNNVVEYNGVGRFFFRILF